MFYSGPGKNWKTTGGAVLQLAQAGLYFAWDLHRSPHGGMPRNIRQEVVKEAKERLGVKVDVVKGLWIRPGSLVHIPVGSAIWEEVVKPMLEDMEEEEVTKRMLGGIDGEMNPERGTWQRYCGYAQQNMVFAEQSEVARPQPFASTDAASVSQAHGVHDGHQECCRGQADCRRRMAGVRAEAMGF